jgi:uncharacterized repeat protein (TIGR01451 family)
MNKALQLFAFLILFSKLALTQDCPTNIEFFDQTDVDVFLMNYPDCSVITGNVTVWDGAINLNALNGITEIQGDLDLQYNSTLQDLSGLSNLTTVGGTLRLPSAPITGMSSLTNVSRWVILWDHVASAADLETLSNQITSPIDYLEFDDSNDAFTGTFAGFENVPSITNLFFYNTSANYEGFTNLSSINNLSVEQFISAPIGLPAFPSLTEVGECHLFGVDNSGEPLSMGTGPDCQFGNVYITDCLFTDFTNWSQVAHIGGLNIQSGIILSLNGLENLDWMSQFILESVEGLQNLAGLEGLTLIVQLNIGWCYDVQNLDGIGNVTYIDNFYLHGNDHLIDISALNPIIQIIYLEISSNPSLSNCSVEAICNNLDVAASVINNNAGDCVDLITVVTHCTGYSLTGNAFYDLNCNGTQEETEINASNLLLLDDTDRPVSWMAILTGEYFVPLNGNTSYTLHAETYPGFTSEPFTITTGDVAQNFVQDIALCPQGAINNLEVTIVPLNAPRPGFNHDYLISVYNHGTESAEGNLTFSRANMGNVTVVNSNGGLSQGSTINWPVTIAPFEVITFSITLHSPSTVALGTEYIAFANVQFTDNTITDIESSNNQFSITQTVIGSYDPNIKTVDRNMINYLDVDVNESVTLEYTIQFQNTGTASAVNVIVEDVIESDLNLSTFHLLYASHPVQVSFDDNKLIFTFENINLPDSTSNEPESHGFVLFRIKSQPNIPIESIIENSAAIYFDFNEPIITNSASTSFYECPDNIDIVGPTELCISSLGEYALADSTYTDYTWLIDGLFLSNETIVQVIFDQIGTHSVALLAESNLCIASQVVDLNVVENPTLSLTVGSLDFCNQVSLSAASNYGVVWTLDGNFYSNENNVTATEDGTYLVVASNQCGSLSESTDIIVPAGPSALTISNNAGVLSSSEPGSTYEWYLNGQLITGANTQEITATASGNYSLIVTFPSGCTMQAAAIFVEVGLEESLLDQFSVYPNPANDYFIISQNEMQDGCHIKLIDLTGKVILVEKITTRIQRIDTSNIQSGMYFIQMIKKDGLQINVPITIE